MSKYYISTVYIGGGTPSTVDGEYIFRIISSLKDAAPFDDNAELSIEVNPGTLSFKSASLYRSVGINRVSIGLQSTFDDELEVLGRVHSYQDFESCLEIVRSAGFQNINVDLMSSLPKQSVSKFLTSLDRVCSLKAEHISVYELIIEDNTEFSRLLSSGELELPSEDQSYDIYCATRDYLKSRGYKRYEISNYAKEGYECRHNLTYWNREEYLGLGLGTASLIDHRRFSASANLTEYIESGGAAIGEDVKLSQAQEMEEFMFLGLRKTSGVDEEDFKKYFGADIRSVYGDVLDRQIRDGIMTYNGRHFALSNRGLDVSNVVLAEYLL